MGCSTASILCSLSIPPLHPSPFSFSFFMSLHLSSRQKIQPLCCQSQHHEPPFTPKPFVVYVVVLFRLHDEHETLRSTCHLFLITPFLSPLLYRYESFSRSQPGVVLCTLTDTWDSDRHSDRHVAFLLIIQPLPLSSPMTASSPVQSSRILETLQPICLLSVYIK